MKTVTVENIVGKGENDGNQYSLLFPQDFHPFQIKFQFFKTLIFLSHLEIISNQRGKKYYLLVKS